jgi:GTPase SAR1 family protein
MTTKKCAPIQKSQKLVIVGHPMSGKSTLLLAFEHKQFFDSCRGTVFDTPVVPVQTDGKTVS